MQMTFRWFGDKLDTVTLQQIRQIPNVTGVVPALHDLPAGEAWSEERVQAMYEEITAAGPVFRQWPLWAALVQGMSPSSDMAFAV